jgi:general secretion pathway protein B
MRPINQHLLPPATPVPAPAAANPNTPAVPAPTAQPTISRAPPPPAPVAAAKAKPSAEPAIAPPPAQQANAAAAQPDAAPTRPADAPPPLAAAPAVPQYYELAYAVRKDIPQFNLSMHVFAPDAAARFIVADGERKVEGDAVKEGLVLREVRTDGIILEFRGQRFFYPRPGH